MAQRYKFRKYTDQVRIGSDGQIQHVNDMDFNNHFASPEEIKNVLRKVDLTADSIPLNQGGAAFISDTKEAYVDDGDYHTLILGSTGSMKTRLFIFPTVYTLALAGENMVIADPKGEIFERTSGYLRHKGYEVRVLNMRDLNHSDCWNPLAEAYTLYSQGRKDEGLKLAIDFIDVLMADPMKRARDIYWPMAAKQFLQGAIEIMIRGAKSSDEVNISSVFPFFGFTRDPNNSRSTTNAPLRIFANKLPASSNIRRHVEHAVSSAYNTTAGVLGQASGALSPFAASKALQKISAKSTIDLHAFKDPDKKTAVFLIVPDEVTTFHFFIASFIKQLYSTAVDDAYHCEDGKLPRRLNFILDEFANIPRIPEMSTMITAARSRNIRFYLVVQSDNQLHDNYEKEAETIKTNCLNWIYLTTKESPLIDQVQKMAGTSKRGINSKPLISFYELTSMRKVRGEEGGADALILISRCKPFMSFLPDISRYTQFENYPSIELAPTDPSIRYFDALNCAFNLPKDKILEVYGDVGNTAKESIQKRKNPIKFR